VVAESIGHLFLTTKTGPGQLHRHPKVEILHAKEMPSAGEADFCLLFGSFQKVRRLSVREPTVLDPGSRIQDPGSRFQVPGFRFQVSGFRPKAQDARCKMQGFKIEEKAYFCILHLQG